VDLRFCRLPLQMKPKPLTINLGFLQKLLQITGSSPAQPAAPAKPASPVLFRQISAVASYGGTLCANIGLSGLMLDRKERVWERDALYIQVGVPDAFLNDHLNNRIFKSGVDGVCAINESPMVPMILSEPLSLHHSSCKEDTLHCERRSKHVFIFNLESIYFCPIIGKW